MPIGLMILPALDSSSLVLHPLETIGLDNGLDHSKTAGQNA